MPKYKYSEFTKNFFEVIDTPAKAYVLGFLFADGCVNSRRNTVDIKLQIKDITLLYKIKEALQLENPIREYESLCQGKRYKSCGLSFTNKKIKRDLIARGCTPKKTLTLKAPQGVPDHLAQFFIAGYFDGDGSIFFSKTHQDTYVPKMDILGTKDILNYIDLHSPNEWNEIKKDKRCKVHYMRSITREDIVSFGKYIYSDSPLFLQRKKDKFERAYKFVENYVNERYTKVRNKETGEEFDSILAASKTVDTNYNTIGGRLRYRPHLCQFEHII